MSTETSLFDSAEPEVGPGTPTPGPRGVSRFFSCAVVLAVLAVLVGGAGVLLSNGLDRAQDLLGGPADYSGQGTGSVLFEVEEGQAASTIGSNLKTAGVVRSVEAFTDAAADEPDSRGIQVGYYQLRKKMAAQDALAVLIDPDNLVQAAVTIPEGARVRDVVQSIVADTDITQQALTKALRDEEALALPTAARGNPEGYLFPATYPVSPKQTAAQLLGEMVSQSRQVTESLNIRAGAKSLGLTTEQVITVASILEYEANRPADYPKVARVIYNRLDQGIPLQLDSTVSYASGREGDVWTTAEERAGDSRYNTYRYRGLPPGPIGSPGEETLQAALRPARGDWLYFVPDFAEDKTLFTASYAQHLRNVERAKQYCRTHEEC